MAKKRKNFIREKRIYCGEEYLEVDIVAVTNMPEAGKGKKGKSSQAQKNLNDKRSKRRFVQIANTNFGTNDFHISATYNNEHLPMSLEEAEKNVHNYLDRIKRKMKRETGEDLMWSTTRINWKKANDPEYRANVDYYGFVNCDRLQPNENGLEGIVNYINKRKKGCKKWSTSMNLKKPKVKKNDHKWSFRKLREYAKTPEDKEVWRKLYKGYEPNKIDFEYNDYTGWNFYLRLRKVRD